MHTKKESNESSVQPEHTTSPDHKKTQEIAKWKKVQTAEGWKRHMQQSLKSGQK